MAQVCVQPDDAVLSISLSSNAADVQSSASTECRVVAMHLIFDFFPISLVFIHECRAVVPIKDLHETYRVAGKIAVFTMRLKPPS